MKNLPWIGIGLLAFLVVSTQMPPTTDVVEQAKQYFTDADITEGQDFAMQRRWIFWGNALAQLLLLIYLAFTPLGKRIYLACGVKAHNHWFGHLVLIGAAYFLISTVLALPFRLAQYFLNVQWEMTNQSLIAWLGDYLLGVLVTALLDGAVFLGLYVFMKFFPKHWWALGGAASMIFGFFVASIYPDVIQPLFNTFTPISQTKWKTAEPRIQALGSAIGVKGADVYVVVASRQGVHSNAYFTGFGSTQRIVLYDNLLENHSNDEVDTIIAHEMGHWWEMHIIKGIVIGGIAVTLALYLLFRHMSGLIDGGVLRSASDPAGAFRVLLLGQLAIALSLPIQNGISRWFERQADEHALTLSKKPQAFIEAEKRLAKLNKSNVTPSRLNVFLFASHPPIVERIQMAEQWKDKTPSK